MENLRLPGVRGTILILLLCVDLRDELSGQFVVSHGQPRVIPVVI